MRVAAIASVLGCVVVAFGLAARAEQKPGDNEAAVLKEDLRRFQGTWEMVDKIQGHTICSRQVIAGNRCTVTRTDENGQVVEAHTAEFTLSLSGKTKLFTYFNLRVTAGAHKGETIPQRRSFLYRIGEHAFYEVYGLLVDQREEATMIVWRRVKERIADRAPAAPDHS